MRLFLFVFTFMTLSFHAQAQNAPKRKTIRLDEITVEGKIQKPQAFYIIPRSGLNYQGLDSTESFLQKVTKSTEQNPF